MESKTYQKWALTKEKAAVSTEARLVHGALGSAGEVGEMVDIIKKHSIYGKPLDVEHVKEEVGDALWYIAIILDSVGSSFEEVMQMNHDKLEKRYAGGYTDKAALERVDVNAKET